MGSNPYYKHQNYKGNQHIDFHFHLSKKDLVSYELDFNFICVSETITSDGVQKDKRGFSEENQKLSN